MQSIGAFVDKRELSIAQVRDIPKVSLHDHLDGAVRVSTILELSRELNLPVPQQGEADLLNWISEKCGRGSLEEYLEVFSLTSSVMQTYDGLKRVAREFVLDCAEDGIIYVECRWAPYAHVRGGLRIEEAIEAVSHGLKEGELLASKSGRAIFANQIFCALRHENHSLDLAKLALVRRDQGVVGFDLAGPEQGFPPSLHSEALELLNKESFPVTIHAGEADGIESIQSALTDGYARRLGHGVRIASDIKSEGEKVKFGKVASQVHDRGIVLELAPRSNLQTNASIEFGQSLASHPFDLLYQLGFAVTVNPDNRLMSNTSITEELYDLSRIHGYTLEDLKVFQQNALRSAFGDLETLVECRQLLQTHG